MSDLITRLRSAPLGSGSTLHAECADALEAKDARIATIDKVFGK